MTDDSVFEGATEEQYIELQQGDVCVMYTDGITEARNGDDEEFGYEKLLDIIGSSRKLSAEDIKDKILTSVRTFIGDTAYNDDMTLVVIKWTAPVPDPNVNDAVHGKSRRNKKETVA